VPEVGTLTKTEYVELRGDLGGTWQGAAIGPPNGKAVETQSLSVDRAPRLCAGECGTVLSGRPGQKWCSPGCRARYRRLQAPVRLQEVANGKGMDDSPSRPPAFLGLDVLELLQGLPAILRAGWRLEATSVSVSVIWHA
jgi:hypothetical protein